MTAPALHQPSAPRPSAPRTITTPADLSPAERVAVVLSLMDPDQARTVAADWSPAEVDRVVAAYEAMGALPRPVVLEVLAGFVAELASPNPAVRGGHRQASALAAAIMPEAEDPPDGAPQEGGIGEDASPEAVWAYAGGLAPEALARLIADERPAVAAAVLTRLGEAKGAALMAALDEPLAVAAALRLADAPALAPGTMDAIAEALRGQAADGGAEAPTPEDGAAGLTALLNRCPHARQEAVLVPLRERAPEVADKVEAGLVRFGTLAERLPRTAAPALFREADQDTLDTALRYGAEAQPEATEYLYANISQRLAEQIRERVAERPMPDAEAGEAAQAAIIGTLLGWAEEGRFAMRDAAAGTAD